MDTYIYIYIYIYIYTRHTRIQEHLGRCSGELQRRQAASSSAPSHVTYADQGRLVLRHLDLSDLASVHKFSENFLQEFQRCECVVCFTMNQHVVGRHIGAQIHLLLVRER
jgi:hypothetical protein